MSENILEIRDLAVEFLSGEQRQRVVEGVSFDIRQGETLALVGESGSGKSVTAHSILRLLPYSVASHPAGSIHYQGEDLLKLPERRLRGIRGNRIAMVFQEPMTSLNPLHTIEKQLAEVLALHKGLWRQGQRENSRTARVGRHPRAGQAPESLSTRTLRRPAAA